MPPQPVRRHSLPGLLAVLLAALCGWLPAPVRAQAAELTALQTSRSDGALELEFAVRLNLPRTVEDAMYRGVPVYFVAEARLLKDRWYWRDERVARVRRTWRVAYQPLTGSWRVGLGGLNQTTATLADALLVATRSAGWKLVDLDRLDADGDYALEFSYRLDSSQLPGPMQFGLGGQNDWSVGVSRTIKVVP